ncbi:hypothetical protein LOAG_16778 [Loa loa]|nr:hypothetical protein LOAG_16778 [Loa loa]EJD76207.1 hypothetical protein LOAG_16778 [Loa loa]
MLPTPTNSSLNWNKYGRKPAMHQRNNTTAMKRHPPVRASQRRQEAKGRAKIIAPRKPNPSKQRIFSLPLQDWTPPHPFSLLTGQWHPTCLSSFVVHFFSTEFLKWVAVLPPISSTLHFYLCLASRPLTAEAAVKAATAKGGERGIILKIAVSIHCGMGRDRRGDR